MGLLHFSFLQVISGLIPQLDRETFVPMTNKLKNNHRDRGATYNCAINMNFAFLFTIAFLVLSLVRGCMVDVQQPTKPIRKKERQTVSMPCSVNISSCQHTPQISWYVFRKDFHYQIDVSSQPLKYNLEHYDLKISSLSKADCGVYYCAAALPIPDCHSGAPAIGQGTTLKVSETGLNTRQALLLTLLVLLTVYSLIVLGIIVCIKTGRFTSVFIRWSKSKKEDSARQVLFSGVVQELRKRNLSDKIQARYKVSQDKSNGLQNVEDVYQNLDE